MLFTVSRKLFCTLRVTSYEKCKSNILIVSVVKLMAFKSQTSSRTLFREPSPATSHLLKFAFSLQKREYTLNVSIRFLADNKSLRKKVESSAIAVHKKTLIKDCYSSYISIIFD